MNKTQKVKIFFVGSDYPETCVLDAEQVDQVIKNYSVGRAFEITLDKSKRFYNSNHIELIILEEVKEDE